MGSLWSSGPQYGERREGLGYSRMGSSPKAKVRLVLVQTPPDRSIDLKLLSYFDALSVFQIDGLAWAFKYAQQ